MYGTRDAASKWECDQQNHVKRWGYMLEQSSKKLFHNKGNVKSGVTHGDDFLYTRPKSQTR